VALADDTEPQPDLAVLRRREVPYKDREPGAPAETSLAYDRRVKRQLYAEAGIPENWIVDCAAETVEVHRAPPAAGYRDVCRATGEDTVSPAAFPDVVRARREIFA
jgi:Uma2 family endonuclease